MVSYKPVMTMGLTGKEVEKTLLGGAVDGCMHACEPVYRGRRGMGRSCLRLVVCGSDGSTTLTKSRT